MSLISRLRHARHPVWQQLATARWLHASNPVLGMGSHRSDNDPVVLHKEKTKTLKGEHQSTMKSHPGWNEHLASDSEVAIKADKEDQLHDEHGEHITKLQEHTVETIEKSDKNTSGDHASQEPDALKRGVHPR